MVQLTGYPVGRHAVGYTGLSRKIWQKLTILYSIAEEG